MFMNPFRYGQVVDKSNYCRRPDLEKKVRSRLLSGQNTYIEGERRTGKTSLIFQTVEATRSRWIVYIDLLEVKTIEDVYKRVLNGMARAKGKGNLLQNLLKGAAALRPTMTFDPVSGLPSVSIDTAIRLKPESLDGLLDLLMGREFRNAVVTFDEFQDIRNLTDSQQVLAVIRSKVQFCRDIPFIFCGSIRSDMHAIFTDPDSPFFKSALPVEVGPIDRIAFREFIAEKFSAAKIRVSASIIDRILLIANENPGDTQQLCSAIYDVTRAREQVGEDTIIRALQNVFGEERKGYEAHLARITAIQLKCLVAVAKEGGRNTSSREFITLSGVTHATTISKALKRLKDLKILFYINGEYKFVNPFFAQWLVHMNY